MTIAMPGGVSTRYLRITQTGSSGSWWSIHEIRLFRNAGTTSQDPELSRPNWIANASLASSNAWAALDRNSLTRWDTGTRMQNGQWFKVDLGTAQTFNQVVLEYTGSADDFPRGYVLAISDNNATWTDVKTGAGSSGSTTITLNGAVTTRFVRVTQTGSSGSWWSIHEFRLLMR
jgi:hypothetical protein